MSDHFEHELLEELRHIRQYFHRIVELLERKSQPDSFSITERGLDQPIEIPALRTSSGAKHMTTEVKNKAGVDLSILDDGKGVLYTLTPVKANPDGTTTPEPLPAGTSPIVGTPSDPVLNVAQDPGDPSATPPRPADTTGLVFLGSIATPKDVAGVVVTFKCTLPNGNVISTDAPPVDVVPDPNNPNNPTGFTIAEAAV